MPETDATQHPHLYRAIRKKRWYDSANRHVLPVAFELRESDKGKLSVLKSVNCLPGGKEECNSALRECYGEFTLPTADVRSIGLDVSDDDPDDPEFSANHASIVGIPPPSHDDESLRRANDLQAHLAEISTLHYDRDDRFK